MLEIDGVAPDTCIVTMSKPFASAFNNPKKMLLPNERYYVGAMYQQTLPSGSVVYGAPEMAE